MPFQDPALYRTGPEMVLGPTRTSQRSTTFHLSLDFNSYPLIIILLVQGLMLHKGQAMLWGLIAGATQCPCKIDYILFI